MKSWILLFPPMLVAALSQAQAAERMIVCNAIDRYTQEESVLRLNIDSPKIEAKIGSGWVAVYDGPVGCGQAFQNTVCEHNIRHNLDDPSFPNKSAYDQVSCLTADGRAVSQGQIQIRLHTGNTGKFWCNIRGTRAMDLELNSCVVEKL